MTTAQPPAPGAPIVLGWREWLALPRLGIGAIKAKIDSGARTSALHVVALEEFEQDGAPWLRFVVPTGRRNATPVACTAPAVDRRAVSDSGGHVTQRSAEPADRCPQGLADDRLTHEPPARVRR